MRFIDLNCDLGEGGGQDDELMPLISSCNIACGGHYGNQDTVFKTVNLALKNQVNIGAHPSYPDQLNFGRKSMQISIPDLRKSISAQIKRVSDALKAQNGTLYHVKPHGAFYNDLNKDIEKSELLIEIVQKVEEQPILFVPPNSVIEKLAKGKIEIMVEGFADRNYEANLSAGEADFRLVSRTKKGAVLTEKKAILERVLKMVKEEKIPLENSDFLHAKFDTICLHSDSPNCLEILHYLNLELPKNGIQICGK